MALPITERRRAKGPAVIIGVSVAALAGALHEHPASGPIGIILTGGNVDRDLYTRILNEEI